MIFMNSTTSSSDTAICIPCPPSTYEGLTSTGYPSSLAALRASSTVNTVCPLALGICVCSRISSKSSLSSAASTSSALVPRIGTPIFISASVSLIAVCPPNCTTAPSGFSNSTIDSTSSAVSGSK